MSRRLPPTGLSDPGDEQPPIDPAGWSFSWHTPRYARPEPPCPLLCWLSLAELDRLVALRRAVRAGGYDETCGERRRWRFWRLMAERGLIDG